MSNSKPIKTLRDGLISASIWCSSSDDGQKRYSVTFSRSYLQGEEWRTAYSFSGAELLRLSKLTNAAYDHIATVRHEDRVNRQSRVAA